MTLKLNRVHAVVKVHLHAKYHQAECSGSWVIVQREKKTLYENNTVRRSHMDSNKKLTASVMAAIQLVFNWIIYSTNVSHVCEQVETTNNTYWHLWQTYLPMPRAFSLALHSRHRALNEHSTNISSMKRIWLMTWQVFCYKPSHYTLSYKATRENITYYAMNTLHWWRSSAQLWLQAKKQRARIFRKPLASYLSAEHG